MIDGLDGVGKGVVIDAIIDFEKSKERKIFDVNKWWDTDLNRSPARDFNPRLKDFFNEFMQYELLVTSEPTFAGIGRRIRNEYIKKNDRDYDPWLIAQAYALDRYELYTTTVIPARENGINIIQSRGVVTSLVYQGIDMVERGSKINTEDVLKIYGNEFTMKKENAPTLLLIPTVSDIDALEARLKGREKQDDSIFENMGFQRKIKPHYESENLRKLFNDIGTEVKYLDAGISLEYTKAEAVRIWKEHLGV